MVHPKRTDDHFYCGLAFYLFSDDLVSSSQEVGRGDNYATIFNKLCQG